MNWLDLLRAAVDRANQSQVARDLGVSPATVNQVLKGTYGASTERMAARVLDLYGRAGCPHLGHEISGSDCRGFRTRPIPTSNPHALNHWAACQACPNNPKENA